MKPPVRIVCRGCLQSVDQLADQGARHLTVCPSCGLTLESDFSDLVTPTSGYVPPDLTADFSSMGSGAVTARGGEAGDPWERGALGSIDRFILRDVLGDGGFGRVYKAYDPRLDRTVALKVLKPNDPDDRIKRRFFREARAVAALNHPSIVKVHDSGCDGPHYWVAYELIKGRTLSRILAEERRLDFLSAAKMTRGLADALGHAHGQSVFHRDLKPANVVVDTAGNPHLIDFGLARRADCDSDLTRDGAVIGTPTYMPPEQAAGRSRAADARSDIYSLGLVFYEMLCGRRAVDLRDGLPAWQKSAGKPQPIPPPRTVNREIPPALARICMKALACDASERYPDAPSLCLDLDRWINQRRGVANVSHSLTSIVLGIGAALVLVVGLTAMSVLVAREPNGDRVAEPKPRELAGPPPQAVGAQEPPSPPRRGAQGRAGMVGLLAGATGEPVLDETRMVKVFKKGDRYHTTQCPTVRRDAANAVTMSIGEAVLNNPRSEECRVCSAARRAAGGAQAR